MDAAPSLAALEPGEMDPVQAHHSAAKLVARLRDVARRRRVVHESYLAQLGEIQTWHNQQAEGFDKEWAYLTQELRPLVTALLAGESRKSLDFPAGRVGFRAGRERVIVEDQEAAIAWLVEHGYDRDADCVRVKRELSIPSVKHIFPRPDTIPGIRVETSPESFYVDPIESGQQP